MQKQYVKRKYWRKKR